MLETVSLPFIHYVHFDLIRFKKSLIHFAIRISSTRQTRLSIQHFNNTSSTTTKRSPKCAPQSSSQPSPPWPLPSPPIPAATPPQYSNTTNAAGQTTQARRPAQRVSFAKRGTRTTRSVSRLMMAAQLGLRLVQTQPLPLLVRRLLPVRRVLPLLRRRQEVLREAALERRRIRLIRLFSFLSRRREVRRPTWLGGWLRV